MVQLTTKEVERQDQVAARRQLETILDATEQECGLEVALRAAATLRTAITQGTINGGHYRPDEYGGWTGRCAIGHLAQGVDPDDPYLYRHGLPGYSFHRMDMPLEGFVMGVRPGQTVTDNDDLALLAGWLDSWTAAHS